MASKINTYVALLFAGYTTVNFAMEQDMAAILRKLGVRDEHIQGTLAIANRNKSSEEIVKDFHDLEPKKEFDIYKEIKEFTDVKDTELSLDDFPENKPKSILNSAASTMGAYYNWFTGTKK